MDKLQEFWLHNCLLVHPYHVLGILGGAKVSSKITIINNIDNKKLKEIYDEINKLEKTEVEEFKYSNAKEIYRIFILISISLILIEWIFRSTIFKSFI